MGKILDAVNKEKGLQKSLKSIRQKIDRIKAKYKKTFAENRKNGRGRQKCKHYEEMDLVLNTRTVVNIPAALSAGQPAPEPTDKENVAPERNLESESKEHICHTVPQNNIPKYTLPLNSSASRSKQDSIQTMRQILNEQQEKIDKSF